jgi:hypothetical protein
MDPELQSRTEPSPVAPEIMAALRSEVDGQTAALRSEMAALQTQVQARAQDAAPDVSTRAGEDARIAEALDATRELRTQNEALRAEMTALSARAQAPGVQSIVQPRSNVSELAAALIAAGLDLGLCARGMMRDGMISARSPIDLSARAVTTISQSMVSALSTPGAVGPFDLGVPLPRSYADFIPELPDFAPLGLMSVPFVRETQRNASGAIHLVLTAQTESGSAVLTVDTTAGVGVGFTLRIHDAEGLIERKVLTVDSATQITCTETMGQTIQTATSVTCLDFGTTAESNTKPAMIAEYEASSLAIQTLAHYIPCTQQAIAVAPQLEAMLRQMLTDGLKYTLHRHFAYGTGAAASGAIAGQVHGTITSTTSPTQAWSAGAAGDTMFDALLRAWAQLRYSAPVTVHVNPLDLISMIVTKASTAGQYVFPFAGGAVPGTIGTNGVISTPLFDIAPDWTMDQTDFHVVQHSLFSAKIRNSAMDRVAVGWINAQFVQNQFTMLAEVGIEHLVQRPGACVIGEWDSAPS